MATYVLCGVVFWVLNQFVLPRAMIAILRFKGLEGFADEAKARLQRELDAPAAFRTVGVKNERLIVALSVVRHLFTVAIWPLGALLSVVSFGAALAA